MRTDKRNLEGGMGKARRRRNILAAAISALAIFATSAPAFAASWHGVSGTVYSPCSGNIWFTSSTARTKAGTGSVQLQFSQLNPGGVTWNLLGPSNQQYGVTQSWTGNETGITRTLDSSMGNGTTFYNHFKEYDGKCGYGNYSFAGSEWY
ncbi:MAG: hypothetical protein QOI26_2143 [Pseudonocardiales bacterium]|jgi:hypothetical protein|nr:hypothetical protein [Pseudonocardiales bacterium]